MKKIYCGVIALGLLVGCSSIRVTTDYAEDTDFSKFQTFAYEESENTVARSSPLAHQRIVTAIRRGMTSSGLTEVDKDPDLKVTYRGSTEQQVEFRTTYSGASTWGRPSRYRGVGVGMTTSTTRPSTITQGTLMIDIWDVAANAMVWRSVATSTLSSDPSQNTSTINKAVEKAFNDFPPQ